MPATEMRATPGAGALAGNWHPIILRGGKPLPASAPDELLRQVRGERDLANLGKGE